LLPSGLVFSSAFTLQNTVYYVQTVMDN
jgi:hypothetical protein